jgi:hypothetical protein
MVSSALSQCVLTSRYDALTRDNKVEYQNTVSYRNLDFFKACGEILTNYAWDKSLLEQAVHFAQEPLKREHIYFGIDIWAQNHPQSFLHPRITYPKFGGGGTNTGFAVNEAMAQGVGVGLFAPAWSWEHFSVNQGPAVNQTVWEGVDLPPDTRCGCFQDTGTIKDHTMLLPGCGITKSATRSKAGTTSFFWTDFARAYERHPEALDSFYEGKPIYSQLSAQSILPMQWRTTKTDDQMRAWLSITNKLTVGVPAGNPTNEPLAFPAHLYSLDITVDQDILYRVRYKTLINDPKWKYSLIIGTKHGPRTTEFYKDLEFSADVIEREININASLFGVGDVPHITRLGVLITIAQGASITLEPTAALEIHNMCLVPFKAEWRMPEVQVSNIQVKQVGNPEHTRLCWDLQERPRLTETWMNVNSHNFKRERPKDSRAIPYSVLTGSVSHFIVEIDGKVIGRVYGCQMVLPPILAQRDIDVGITPVQFGGYQKEKQEARVFNTELNSDWEMVPRTF